MKNNYTSMKPTVGLLSVRSWMVLLLFMLGSLSQFGYAQTTVTIGTGTLTVGGSNGVPIYRSTATSSFHHSKSIQLVTAADMATAGVPSGAVITQWGYNKTTAATISGANAWTMNVYLKNTSATVLASGTAWSTMIAGASLAYTATINSSNFPAVAGYWLWPVTGFVYTGAAVECYIEWFPAGTMATPFASAAFPWQYTTTSVAQAMGNSAGTVLPSTQAVYTTQLRVYNTRLSYVPGAADDLGLQQPALPNGATICNGASTTVSLTLRNNGTNLVDFSVNPATINCSVTGPNGTTFTPVVINSGTLAPSTSQVVTVAVGYNAALSGTYNFSASLSWGIDGLAGNNTLNWSASSAFPLVASSNVYTFCDGTIPQLNATVSSNYVVTSISHAPITPVSPSPGPTGDDIAMTGVPIPFPFTFYGNTFTTLNIITNGFVELGTSTGTGPYGATIPTAAVPNNVIALAWEDLNVTTGNIQYFTSGVAPNRKFVIAWSSVFFYLNTGNVTGQIVLNEADNSVDIFHTNITALGNPAVCGIENGTGTAGVVAPGRQFGTWIPDPVVNEGWHFALPTISYSWSPATGLSNASIANPTATLVSGTSQIYTLTATNSLTGCVSTDTVSLVNLGTANPAPGTISGAACAGASATLSASGVGTLNWYTAAIGGTIAFTGTTWNNTWASTTTYYVQDDNGTCPSARTPVTITVTPQPVVNPTATPSTFCLGTTAQLASNNFVSGNLQTAVLGGNGFAGNTFNISNLNGSSPIRIDSVYMGIASGTLAEVWYKAGGYGCAALTSSAGWTLAGSVAIVAAGGAPALTSIPLNINLTIPVGQSFGFVVVCNGSNYYTNGSAICTPLIGDANISISQGHGGGGMGGAFGFSNAPRNFNGRVFYSFGDPNLTFNWSQTVGTGSISNSAINNPIVTPTSSGLNTYSLTAVNAANCSTTVAVNVTANPIPADANTIASISSFCGCGVATLTSVLPTGGSDVRWYTTATGGTSIGTGTPFNAPYACGSVTYYAEAFDPISGCIQAGARASFTFVPTVAPSISITASDLNLCDGDPAANLTATSANDPNYSYVWTPTTGLTPANGLGASVSALPTATTLYTVTGTETGGSACVSQATVSIGVGNSPIISGATATPSTFCLGGSSQLVVNAFASGGGGPAPTTYGASAATSTADDEIFNVTFGTLNNSSNCFTTGGGSSVLSLYSDYTALTPPNVTSGQSVPFAVTIGYCSGFAYGMVFTIYIDWNRDGDFLDANETSYTNPVSTAAVSGTLYSGSVTVPSFASAGNTRMRVVLVEGTSTAPTGTYTWGETEDYTINVQSGSGFTYAWTPNTNLSSDTISNPIASPIATTTYTVVVSDAGGCTASTSVPVNVVNPPAAPVVVDGTRCGPGSVNLSATGSGGTILWLDTIAGPILASGNNFSPSITSTQTYYVIENPAAVSANIGLSATALGTTAFASSAANYQTFDVMSPTGIIINTVDIVPNFTTPLGTALAVQLEDAAGNALGAPVTTVTTTQGAVQTVTLNMFVPQGTAYRLRTVQNPNLQYHQNGFTNPYTIPGQVAITGWGPPNATTLYVFFYNWSVSIFDGVSNGCFSSASIATATVTPPPTLAIATIGAATYCNTGSVILDGTVNSDPSYVNFSWSPATGLSATNTAVVTATPTVTTTYTLTADDGLPNGCSNTATVTITVNSGPSVSIAPAPLDSLCAGASFIVNATAGSSSFKSIGTGTNSVNNTIAIYDGNNANVKTQVLYTAAELISAGLIGPGNITSAAFNVVNKLSTTPLTGFTMRMAAVATAPPITTSYVAGTFTTVFAGSVSTVLGWNQHVFTTPFFWDGTSNVILEVCNGTPGIPGFDQVQSTPTATAQTIIANLLGCASLTGAVNLNRPNTRFTGGAVNYSWSPAGELSASNIEDPTFTSASNGAKALTLTVTDPSNGCTASATLNFVVSDTPKAPLIASSSNTAICNSASVLVVGSGTTGAYQWQSSSDNATWGDISGQTDDSLNITVSSDTYYRVKASCVNDAFSNSIFFDVSTPALPVGTGATICGQGTAALSASTIPGEFIQWFADSSSSVVLTNGMNYSPFITQTDTFWVHSIIDTNYSYTGLPAPTNYLASAATSTADEEILNVSFGTLNNSSVCGTVAPGAGSVSFMYSNYTGLTAPVVTPGQTVPFSVTVGYCGTFPYNNVFAIYIDWNRDGDFLDASETAFTNPSLASVLTGTAYTGSIVVPAFASGGQTRMRVVLVESTVVSSTGTYTWGETEDYTIEVLGSACASPKVPVIATVTPAPVINISPASAAICEGGSVVLNDANGNYPSGYSWSPALTITNAANGEATASPAITTSYILTGTDGICTTSDTVEVTVNPAPVFTLSPSSLNICNGDTATMSVNVTSPLAGNYNLTSVAFAPKIPTGPVTILTDAGIVVTPQTISSLDDGTWESLPLPAGFAFSYYGNTFTQFNVSTNLFIGLGASSGGAFCCSGQNLPNVGAPNNYLALSHEDFNMTSGTIDYFTNGVAPNRIFVVRFTNAPRFGGTGAPTTGQIELYETTNVIEYHVTSVTTAASDFTTMAIEDGTGTNYVVVNGRNFIANWTATNEGWRFQVPAAATIAWSGQNIIGSTTGTTINAVPSSSGYYNVVVTNPLTGCTKTDSVLVNFAISPKPIIATNDTVLCNPDVIDVIVVDTGLYVGGYPAGTSFTWSAIGAPILDLDTIPSSNGSSYSVIVILPNGCSASSDTAIVLTKTVAVVDVISPATCASPGSIAVTVGGTGSAADFNYVWSTDLAQTNIVRNVTKSNNQDTLSNIGAGTYYLQVYDEAGTPASCNSGVLTYTVGGSSIIVISSLTGTDISCATLADGSADVVWTGGTAPYTITWSDGQFANTTPRSIATGGTYSVIVSDGSGCADTASVVIVEPTPVTITFTSTPESFAGALDGTVTGIASGGTAPYSYEWADEFLNPVGLGNPLGSLAAGLYYGLATDVNGCNSIATILDDTIRVELITDANFTITALIEGFFDGVNGMVPVLATNGISIDPLECDTIRVELRDQLTPTTVVASGTAVIKTNGQAMFTFPGSVIGQNGYIAVFHRNAVQTWSNLITFSANTLYDFTINASDAFGSNQSLLSNGKYGFYSGDVNQDESLDIVDQGAVDNAIFNFDSGYIPTDLTGDGSVGIDDQGILDNNLFNFIGPIHP